MNNNDKSYTLVAKHSSCLLITDIYNDLLDYLTDNEYYDYIDNSTLMTKLYNYSRANMLEYKHSVIENIFEIVVENNDGNIGD
jgi:hypothetical protein